MTYSTLIICLRRVVTVAIFVTVQLIMGGCICAPTAAIPPKLSRELRAADYVVLCRMTNHQGRMIPHIQAIYRETKRMKLSDFEVFFKDAHSGDELLLVGHDETLEGGVFNISSFRVIDGQIACEPKLSGSTRKMINLSTVRSLLE